MTHLVFTCAMATQFELYQQHMIASQKWGDTYVRTMRAFDRHCHEHYPDATELTWEIAMAWCRQRPTEIASSCIARTRVVVHLCKFLNEREMAKIPPLDLPSAASDEKHIPHFITKEELDNFFRAAREFVPSRTHLADKVQSLMAGPFFLTLYSTGARPKEIRMAKRQDFMLDEGLISICKGKGYKQRYVGINDSLNPVLRQYDVDVDQICPNREYFFPSVRGKAGYLSNAWVDSSFRRLWDKYNKDHATTYDFRHNYAITNINAMVDGGFNTQDWLTYLSKTMGHHSIETTKYYYAITPALADTLNEKSGDATMDLYPDLDDDDWEPVQ